MEKLLNHKTEKNLNFENLSNIGWISLTFVRAMKNGQKLAKLHPRTFTKVHGIQQSFSQSETFVFSKISSCFISFMTEIFHFTWILQLPTEQRSAEGVFAVCTIQPMSGYQLSVSVTRWQHGSQIRFATFI